MSLYNHVVKHDCKAAEYTIDRTYLMLMYALVSSHVLFLQESFCVAVDAHAFVVFGIPVCVAKLVLNFIEKYLVNHTTTQGIVIHIPTFVGFAWSSLCCIWQVTNEL